MIKRTGITMVEVLAVVTVASMVLTLMGRVLHKTMEHQHATQRAAEFHRVAARLGHTFRSDVHQALRMKLEQDTLTLSDERGTTTYRVEGSTLFRQRIKDDQTSLNEVLLPACCEFRLDNNGNSVAALIVTLLDPTFRQAEPIAGSTTPKSLRIEATIARDCRYGPATTSPAAESEATP